MRRILYFVLLLYVALLPFERVLRFVSDSGEDSIFKPYRVVGLLLFASWAVWLAATRQRPRFDIGDKTYFLIFGWGILMALFWHVVEGNDLTYTVQGLQLVAFGLGTYLAIKGINLTKREIQWLLMAYVVAQLLAFTSSQAVIGELSGRAKAFYKNPNQLGVAGALCFIFLLYQFLFVKRPVLVFQVLRALGATASVGLIALSGSRGGTSAAVAGTAVLLLILVLRARLRGASVRLLVFAGLLSAFAVNYLDRFETVWEQTDSEARFDEDVAREGAEERWELWTSGVSVGLDHYGVGVGAMQYFSYHLESSRKLRHQVSTTDRTLGTHSDYVDLFACYGVIGLVAFLRYAWQRARSLWRNMQEASGTGDDIAPLGLATLACTLTVMVSQNSFTGGEHFLMMALVDSVVRIPAGVLQAVRAKQPVVISKRHPIRPPGRPMLEPGR